MKTTIDAVKMTRMIRDQNYELFKDKTIEERMAFYQEKARRIHEKLGVNPEQRSSESPIPRTSSK